MSTRRFAAYFLAISAGSTVAFASTLIGRPMTPEKMAEQTENQAALEAASPVFEVMQRKHHHKRTDKVAEVASVK